MGALDKLFPMLNAFIMMLESIIFSREEVKFKDMRLPGKVTEK